MVSVLHGVLGWLVLVGWGLVILLGLRAAGLIRIRWRGRWQ